MLQFLSGKLGFYLFTNAIQIRLQNSIVITNQIE